MSAQKMIIGVIKDHTALVLVLENLKLAGLRDDQLGYTLRQERLHQRMEALARGVVGGVLGAVDLALLPIMGPSDASMALETALPAAENALDRLAQLKSGELVAHSEPGGSVPAQSEEEQQPEVAGGGQRGTSVVTGGVLGGLLGAGVALLIPGAGPAIAEGILVATLSGAAIGSVAGGFLGAFVQMGIPEERAQYYEQEFNAGRAIVTAKAEGSIQEQQVRKILLQHGAYHVEAY